MEIFGLAGMLVGFTWGLSRSMRGPTHRIRSVPIPGRDLCVEGYWPSEWTDEECLRDAQVKARVSCGSGGGTSIDAFTELCRTWDEFFEKIETVEVSAREWEDQKRQYRQLLRQYSDNHGKLQRAGERIESLKRQAVELKREARLRLITAIGIAVVSGAIGVAVGGWVL